MVRAVESVAKRLGNTPAICRKCYIHPAVFEGYLDGSLAEGLKQRADALLDEHDERADRAGGGADRLPQPAPRRGDRGAGGRSSSKLDSAFPSRIVGGIREGETWTEDLLVARQDGVHVLTLNRPDRLNAFTRSLHAALAAALDDAARRPGVPGGAAARRGPRLLRRAGPDRGHPRPGSGRDARAPLQPADPPDPDHGRSRWSAPCTARRPAQAPTSPWRATSCSPPSQRAFQQAFIRIGLVPDAGGTWLLPRLAGSARARGMAMLGEPVERQAGRGMGPDLARCAG